MSDVSEGRPAELTVGVEGGLTVLTPAGSVEQDEVLGALAFRVGIADENITVRGITHLVEHLALTGFRSDTLAWNGSVDLLHTTFTAQGPPVEVARFFAEVTAALQVLPETRLDHERRILQVEARSAPASVIDSLLALRFGPQGAGVADYPEWGLDWLDLGRVQAWAEEWFTADNAVLWSTAALPGPAPALPAGEPRPPRLVIPERTLPVVHGQGAGMLALGSLVPRTVAHAVAASELERRLRRLRHETGASYRTEVGYMPLSDDHAMVTATADVHDELVTEAIHALQAILGELVEDGPSPETLASHVSAMVGNEDGAAVTVARIGRVAHRILWGTPDPFGDDAAQRMAALTPQDVQEAAGGLLDEALLIVPHGAGPAAQPPFTPFEPPPVEPVTGARLRSAVPGYDNPGRLVYSDAGVTHWDGEGRAVTVRFDACSGVISWTDGSRLVYGDDGVGLWLDAESWQKFARVRDCVDRHAPGPVAHLPRAPDRGEQRDVGPVWRFLQGVVDRLGWAVSLVLVGVILGGVIGGTIAGVQRLVGDRAWFGDNGDQVIKVLVLGVLVAAIGWHNWRRERRPR